MKSIEMTAEEVGKVASIGQVFKLNDTVFHADLRAELLKRGLDFEYYGWFAMIVQLKEETAE